MSLANATSATAEDNRVKQLFEQQQRSIWRWTDRNFGFLMVFQFLFGIVAALVISPMTWEGENSETHIHVWSALFLGGLITSLPVYLAFFRPGHVMTRHVIAIGQMLMGALLIHLTGGRIETHFHVFGSLAFLAFYRDWKVVVTGTLVVAADHFLRGVFWPRSVFGVNNVEPFRWIEHVSWVLFEDLFLFVSIRQGVRQSWMLAQRQSDLEVAKSLVESERDRFFDLSVDMLCVANLEGYFVRVNPMFSVKLGYENEELLQHPAMEFVHPDDWAATEEAARELREGHDLIDFETRYRCRNGQYLWLSWSARAPGEGELIYAVARDVTIRKHEALALEDARRTAERARAVAEEANRAKSDFLANMSHEIRTPMNAVIGLTELVLETELKPTQRDYLSTVLESGEALMTIINEILDFSKIEAGKIGLELAPFDLREVVGDMMRSLALRAHRKNLELAWHAGADVPQYVVGDAARLRQILVNLTGNAIKFTEQGEVILDIQCSAKDAERADLSFHIRDTGIGIPKDKLQTIFQEFEQADPSTTRRFGGTGLGLSISSRLGELMGGQIEVKSELGKGTEFFFTLPFKIGQPPDPAITQKDVSLLDGLTAMIVDDNPSNRLILEDLTSNWGMQPISAESGSEALRLLGQGTLPEPKPLVVLTDIHMPDMDGFMLAEEIRKRWTKSDAVIIALTSGGHIGNLRQRETLGISAELLKPVKQSELLDSILRAVAPLTDRCDGEASLPTSEIPSSPNVMPAMRILLVEDGLVNQKLALGMLGMWGHDVTIAENGKTAIDQWESNSFDLILMDLQMPVMGGLAATKEIRRLEQERGGHIPIIAMTAHAMKGDRELCLQAGMDGYVSKPVRKQELIDAVQAILNGSGEEAVSHQDA
ncbi:MAG: response regulator [Planctomycetota bacterium]